MIHCRSCKAPIIWTTIAQTRKQIPLDAQKHEPAFRLVAHNQITGLGTVIVAPEQVAAMRTWRERGVSYHELHWATCPYADEHRRDA